MKHYRTHNGRLSKHRLGLDAKNARRGGRRQFYPYALAESLDLIVRQFLDG